MALTDRPKPLVVFDMDGVLIDSLPAHLDYCQEMARLFGVDVPIPTAAEFKRDIALSGIPISPMEKFFLALGFPAEIAKKANGRYRNEFHERQIPLFDGIENILSELSHQNVTLGIATANVRRVVETCLGDTMRFFRKGSVIADDDEEGGSKADSLLTLAIRFACRPRDAVFVGDQISDLKAARATNFQFLGVSYGWGLDNTIVDSDLADSPDDLYQKIAKTIGQVSAGEH